MNQKHSIVADKVLQRIESGEVSMRPRWQIAVYGLLATITSIAMAVVVIYLANFLVFKVRLELSNSQVHGLRDNAASLVGNFPWVALVVWVASLVFLVWFIKKFDFSYRAGRWVLFGIVLLCIVFGVGLAFTNLNYHLEKGPLRGFYGLQNKNQGNSNQGHQNESLRQKQNIKQK